jgi:hypothetical protein
MGWGIRGQYGHETGAMIAGVLVALVLVFLFCPRLQSLQAARAVALMTLGVSFGGSMTYGQTVGLTHDAPLIGNHAALAWGLLGLFLKGGIWIGFAGLFLGIGLTDKRYTAWELTALLCGATVLLLVGQQLINRPFDPDARLLPRFYFSDHWRWEPDSELKPRRECWGGLLVALLGMFTYVALRKRDTLARQLTLWGFLAGGIGFAGGQCVQAAHAWFPSFFDDGFLSPIAAHINWWNLMETTFGFLFGSILAWGLWRNQHHLKPSNNTPEITLTPWLEAGLLALHIAVLVSWNFLSIEKLDRFADPAITMGILPILGIMAGRWWPYLFVLPVVAIPIAGKTFRELGLREDVLPPMAAACIYLIIPLIFLFTFACHHAQRPNDHAHPFLRWSLLLAVWTYLLLNTGFFRYPWPWEPWTNRTLHQLSFVVCAIGLTLAALLLPSHTAPLKRQRPVLPWENP